MNSFSNDEIEKCNLVSKPRKRKSSRMNEKQKQCRLLQNGSFGKVSTVVDSATNTKLIKKQINFSRYNQHLTHLIFNEVKCLKQLSRHSISKFFPQFQEFFEDNSNYFIIMEQFKGKNLEQYLATKQVSKEEVRGLLQQLLMILKEFHNLGFVHRDLKPSNIIITDQNTLKLVDFGSIKFQDKIKHKKQQKRQQKLDHQVQDCNNEFFEESDNGVPADVEDDDRTYVGTEAQMSPELVNSEEASFSSDMWAYGCIAFKLLTGHNAFEGTCTDVSIEDLRQSSIDVLSPIEYEFIQSLLMSDSNKRMTIVEVQDHPQFKGYNFDSSNKNNHIENDQTASSHDQSNEVSQKWSKVSDSVPENQDFFESYKKSEKDFCIVFESEEDTDDKDTDLQDTQPSANIMDKIKECDQEDAKDVDEDDGRENVKNSDIGKDNVIKNVKFVDKEMNEVNKGMISSNQLQKQETLKSETAKLCLNNSINAISENSILETNPSIKHSNKDNSSNKKIKSTWEDSDEESEESSGVVLEERVQKRGAWFWNWRHLYLTFDQLYQIGEDNMHKQVPVGKGTVVEQSQDGFCVAISGSCTDKYFFKTKRSNEWVKEINKLIKMK